MPRNPIPPFYVGEQLTVRRMQQLADAVNFLLSLQGDGIVELRNGKLTLNVDALLARIPKTAGGGSGIFPVKAQEDAPGDTTLSVKLLDSGGSETGAAFDVINVNGGNWEDLFPHIASGDKLFATEIYGTWYAMPGFANVGACEE